MGFKKLLAFALAFAGVSTFAQDNGNHPEKAVETAKVEAAKPGISYKGVNIQLGGFLASEMVYRSNNMGDDIATAYAKTPFNSANVGYGQAEFRGTERQTRFSLLAQGDVDPTTHLSGYYEVDFLGTSPTANANQSNSYTLRSRNVYGAVDWDEIGLHLLAGQNWSLLTINSKGITQRNEAIPQTVDAQYAVGTEWARQWQLRVVKDWDKKWWLALSLENAQTVGVSPYSATTPDAYQVPAGHLMSAPLSMNSFPDFIVKGAWESSWGHYEVAAIASNIQSHYGGTVTTESNKQNIWTEGVSAGATLPIWTKKMDLTVSGFYGKGLARYATSQLPDATVASDNSLALLDNSSYLVQLAYHVDPKWELYLAYGSEYVGSKTDGTTGYGDGIADNSTCTNTNVTTCNPQVQSVSGVNAAAWWSFYKGSFGQAKLGLAASYTWLTAYQDKSGGTPKTSMTSLYTSLRYYPF